MAIAENLRANLTLPAFVAPMFLVSGTDLAAAACEAGVIGSLTRNHCRDLAELEQQLITVTEGVKRFAEANPERIIGPLAVNISPTFGTGEFREHLAVCKRYGVRIIVTSVGDPTLNAPLVQEYGLLHFHDATTIRFAEKAAAAGADGIVCIGAGGGGHSGLISHLAFVPKVRAMFAGTIVMAGAVSTGATIRAAEVLGADLAYLGTRFIASRESAAPEAYKAMLVDDGVPDVTYTRGVNGPPGDVAQGLAARDRARSRRPVPARGPQHRPSPPGQDPVARHLERRAGDRPDSRHPERCRAGPALQEEYLAACATPDYAAAARAALELGEQVV